MLREILITVFGFVVVANPYVLNNWPRHNKLSNNNYRVCKTKECKSMANLIINGMNKTADPCTDFYSYACGSWPKNYPVPEGKLKWDVGAMVQKKVEAFLKKILQEEPKPNDSVPLTIEKKWIKACMDEDRIEEKGLEPLVKIIEQIGGWPIAMEANKWNEKEYPWQKVATYYASLIGRFSLFSVGILPDSKNSSIQVLALGQPKGSLLKHRFYDGILDDVKKEEEQTEFQSLELFLQIPLAYANYTGNKIDSKHLFNSTARFIKFELDVQKIKSSDNDKEEVDLENNKMTISELQKYYDRRTHYNDTSKIDWLEMIRVMMKKSGIEIDGSDEIVINDKLYLDRLFTLLEVTSHETIVDYVHWSFVMSTVLYLNKEIREYLINARASKIGIQPTNRDRLDQCVANLQLNDGVTYEYLKQYFPESIKEAVTKMAAEIRKEIDNDISHTSWMDSETKLLAREKLKAMKVAIGYPEYYKDEKKFNSIYDGFEVGPDYFDNMMNYIKYTTLESLKNLRKPFDKDQWFMTPLTSNAYYLPPTNSLTIPAGQILIPLYSSTGPVAANYGSFGLIIGHEMSHGFDVTGRKYDKNGNAIPWWSKEVVAAYEKTANCFIKQYDSYKVNGELTQGENIADSSGLNAAFAAYTKKMKKVTKEIRLPGLEKVDGNQLFFISFATTFCQSATPIFESLIEEDVHTRRSVRINGAVSNVDGFSAAFQCSKRSPLNSMKKCVLWE